MSHARRSLPVGLTCAAVGLLSMALVAPCLAAKKKKKQKTEAA